MFYVFALIMTKHYFVSELGREENLVPSLFFFLSDLKFKNKIDPSRGWFYIAPIYLIRTSSARASACENILES